MSPKQSKTIAGSLLFGSVSVSIIFALWLSQVLWLESNQTQVDSYASSILKHAENVAADLTAALLDLDQLESNPCSPADMGRLKQITFNYQFVKDAGRIIDGKILCSALWGIFNNPYNLPDNGKKTRNNYTIWSDIPSYTDTNNRFDISASKLTSVVTSPKAFAAFESPPPELSAVITSPDRQQVMHVIGRAVKDFKSITIRKARICSSYYDICVAAQINSNIFSTRHVGILASVTSISGGFGVLFWYVIMTLLVNRRSMKGKLARAIRNGNIQVAYQPIVQATTGRVRGFEALARWHDKELGDVPPDIFFKIAAELNLGPVLTRNIISKAIHEFSSRFRSNKDLYLSVNLETELLIQPETVDMLIAEAEKNDITPPQIAIEILEGATAEIREIESSICRLRRHGFQIFIDDFGTGYSSLSYLIDLNVDKIKIDRSFTKFAGTDSPAASILLKIFEIARTLNTAIIFEGIENQAQRQAIIVFCPEALAQGWLYSKAVPLNDLSLTY
ncbi:EAL domain-containing protein [Pseudomonas bohemica]|uniref:EAL domain-containing protein n=1 Tax=Pseudomonas bohemica TaxID=2044872 RepID=UPI000DA623CD|nr:EAL domain-containing protein [Pseudomonas bohemica]